MKELKFFKCMHCGNIVCKLVDSGVALSCCASEMVELNPNTTDAALEKHVPVVNVNGSEVYVEVGSVSHPMTEEHLITFITLVTDKGFYTKPLTASDKPSAVFNIADEKAICVYEYCNLHGLWKKDI